MANRDELLAKARRKMLLDQAKAKFQATSSEEPQSPSLIDRAGNAALGVIQGPTLGYGDEISGVINAGFDLLGGDTNVSENYKKYRDISRNVNKRAQEESVGEYGAGQLIGSIPTAIIAGAVAPAVTVGRAAASSAALGAAQGLGSSEGDAATQLKDTAIGGAIGGALGAGTAKLGQVIRQAPKALNDIAETSAVKVFNPTNKQMQKIQAVGENDIGRRLLDDGIVKFGDSAKSAAQKLASSTKATGKEIGSLYAKADSLAKPEQLLTADDLLGAMEPAVRD